MEDEGALDAFAPWPADGGADELAYITTTTVSAPPGRVRRSSLINLPHDPQTTRTHSYSGASSATTLRSAKQATLSRPTTPSVEHLLKSSRSRSPSCGSATTTGGDRLLSESCVNSKTRRHTLAGSSSYQGLASCQSSTLTHEPSSSRLSRIIFPTSTTSTTTGSSSTQTPLPVTPVPARANSEPLATDSTARRTLAPSVPAIPLAPGSLSDRAGHSHIPPPNLLLHAQTDPQIPQIAHRPSEAIAIPPARHNSLYSLIPLTGRFREGLPQSHDPLPETPRHRSQRLAFLPYYTHNETKHSAPSLRSRTSFASLVSKCSSSGDLPTGTLSPLSARSKTDDHCPAPGLRHCPSSLLKRRRRRYTGDRSRTHSRQRKQAGSAHMRPSSTASSFGYTPTSPLSPGPPRNINAVMQPNRNPNAHTRRAPQGFSLPIPRFHPAVYQSPGTSNPSTAASSPRNIRSPNALAPPMSPRAKQRSDDAKQAVMALHQEILRTTGAPGAAPVDQKLPDAPSLVPARSPGEATPLTLEDGPSDYLTAGAARRGQHAGISSQRELVERMIREEEQRRQGKTNVPSSAPVSPAAGA